MRRADLGFITLWFVAHRLICWYLGVRPDATAPGWLWQVLPLEDLARDPLDALWYLHAQPPLFNALIAILLQMPGELSAWLRVLWIGIGFAFPIVLFGWFRLVGMPRWMAHVLVLLFALNPTLVLYENFLFYTYPEALCVLVAMYGLARLPDRPMIFGLSAMALVGLRPLFQPLWCLAIAVATYIRLNARQRHAASVALVLPLVFGLALVVKNGLLFSVWTTGSWYGSHMAQLPRIALVHSAGELHKQGIVSRAFVVGGFNTTSAYPAELVNPLIRETSQRLGRHDVLLRETKANGGINFNHVGHIAVSRQLAKDAAMAFTAHPGPVLHLALDGLRRFLSPASEYAFLDVNRRLLAMPERMYRTAAFPFGTSLLVLLTVLATFVSAAAIFLRPELGNPRLRLAAGYVCVTWLWVSCLSNLMEYGENQRYRFTIDPMMYAWVLAVLWQIVAPRLETAPGPRE